ncbi:hypothetical protein FF36_06402 [Frankia torreyi]|uniref:Uncharacterized protein n=1 Tax=Frankia torreyi TaxID=1856 RepID=A0A0D8B573_9ACTN|nr:MULTISPECIES: hypothetical protein [Frankia]KJE19326.1 hypothetical protein FF36_06402 [Frankia torreyi]KQM03598.1 hypothetical protein FF86_10375 [Frankia sp. CpI1-P]
MNAVPEHLRPVVLLARMRTELPPERVLAALLFFDPPIDPDGAAWHALCQAVDAYDTTAPADLSAARWRINVAAAAVLRPTGPTAPPTPPTHPAAIPSPRRHRHERTSPARIIRAAGPGGDQIRQAGMTAQDNRAEPARFLERLRAALAVRVGADMPHADQGLVDEIVGRVLGLLADSADRNRTHPLADPTVWLVAHALRDPTLHPSLADLPELHLPGLTLPVESFERDAGFWRLLASSRDAEGNRT